MNKFFFKFLCMATTLMPMSMYGQTNVSEPIETVTFRFVPEKNMFYIPWGGNDIELQRLYSIVDKYREDIISGRIPVFVDAYCASLPSHRTNLYTAFIRANRVKSELITNKGLLEEHFRTKNYTVPYEGIKDIVIVTLRMIGVSPQDPAPVEIEKPKETEPEPVAEAAPEPEPKQLSHPSRTI